MPERLACTTKNERYINTLTTYTFNCRVKSVFTKELSLRIVDNFAKLLNTLRNYTVMSGVYKFLLVFHCNYVCLVPFLRYSMSHNGVPLKSMLRVTHNENLCTI